MMKGTRNCSTHQWRWKGIPKGKNLSREDILAEFIFIILPQNRQNQFREMNHLAVGSENTFHEINHLVVNHENKLRKIKTN